MKLLVIEDEAITADYLRQGLGEAGFVVDLARNGLDGHHQAMTGDHDLLILDRMLPGIDGVALLKAFRNSKQTPVLMLTARSQVEDRVSGLQAGADDYLVKPFEFLELLARVKALLRRSAEKEEQRAVLRVADLELDLDQKIARRAGQDIELTAREYLLLEYLMRNRGRVLSRLDIAENVWDIHFDTGTNVIDVYINYLRKKIDASGAKLIHTVVGMGYTLKEK